MTAPYIRPSQNHEYDEFKLTLLNSMCTAKDRLFEAMQKEARFSDKVKEDIYRKVDITIHDIERLGRSETEAF